MAKKENNKIGKIAKIFGIVSISVQGLIIALMFLSTNSAIATLVNVLLALDALFIMLLLAPAGIILSIIGLVKKQKGSGLGLGLCIPCLILPLILFAIHNFILANIFSSTDTYPVDTKCGSSNFYYDTKTHTCMSNKKYAY